MSKARIDTKPSTSRDVRRAVKMLNEAQAIVDTLDRPEIGARLQDVIEALSEEVGASDPPRAGTPDSMTF